MNQTIIHSTLQHFGKKGMKWGIINEEKPLGLRPLPGLAPQSSSLPKAQPRSEQPKDRIRQEIRDDQTNRITNFNQIPRFDPKTESLSDAIRKVNEGYAYASEIDRNMALQNNLLNANGKIKTFNNNCPSATMAFELRRRGLDVEAGLTGGMGIEEIGDAFNIPITELFDNMIPPKTMAELTQIMSEMGPGARGFCSMSWKGGSGHICSFEVDQKGNVIFIDAQTGCSSSDKNVSASDNPANYYQHASSYFVVRLDNRKLNKNKIQNYVRLDDRIEPKDVDRQRNKNFVGPKKMIGPQQPKKVSAKNRQKVVADIDPLKKNVSSRIRKD